MHSALSAHRSMQVEHLEAAQAVTAILNSHEIEHAYIGGFAVNCLGHHRTTLDIDVEIRDASGDINSVLTFSRQLLSNDGRFLVINNKLFFNSENGMRIPIETLPAGQLGLPRSLPILQTAENIPILRPGLLILTKIKRCVHLLHSSRPRSVAKLRTDLSDIVFLMTWLREHGGLVDLAGYGADEAVKQRLFDAVKDIIQYWRGSDDGSDRLMLSVLEAGDKDRIMKLLG